MTTVYLSALQPFIRPHAPPRPWWRRSDTSSAIISPRPFDPTRRDDHAALRSTMDVVIAQWCIDRGYMSVSTDGTDLTCTYSPAIHHAMTAVLEINPLIASTTDGYNRIRSILETDALWFEDIQRLAIAIIHAIDDVAILDHYITRMYAAWQSLTIPQDIAWDVVHATIPFFWAVMTLNAFLMRHIPIG